jgi:hypothetical protein
MNNELATGIPFLSNGLQALSAEPGNGDVTLQWRKLDGSYTTKDVYAIDSLVAIPSHSGLTYRVLLTGDARAALY